jgi:hypothetical protein|tara:strand:- start:295 stop:450 length:156 start_codon:yes stop_codon:yes gene_type:complete
MKNKKHKKIVDNYDKQKSKHLERLASKTLANDEKAQLLKSKVIKGDFLKNF